jgi:hypothetical protein
MAFLRLKLILIRSFYEYFSFIFRINCRFKWNDFLISKIINKIKYINYDKIITRINKSSSLNESIIR